MRLNWLFKRYIDIIMMNYNSVQFYSIQNETSERFENLTPKVPKHKQISNDMFLNQCRICGLVNFNSWALTMHMRRHNNERPSKCSYCPASFVNNSELKSHLTRHTKEMRYKCRFCSESFTNNSSRYFHEDKHGILQHKCKFCDLKFQTKILRRNHQKSHGKEDLTCGYCPKKFVNIEFLKVHEANDHGRIIRSLKCLKCKLAFVNKEDLSVHKKIHKSLSLGSRRTLLNPKSNEVSYFQDSDIKLSSYFFTCGVCSEKFSFHIDLAKHIENSHQTEKDNVYKFKCDICNKSFDSQIKLRGHKIGHGPKKHNCLECDYKTARAKDLERHVEARHSSFKAYRCSECGEAFSQYYNFVNHKLKHGDKKFKCQKCEKAYYVKSRLSKHIRSVHNSERQVCDQCGRVYSNMLSLKVHKNYMHKTPPLCLCNHCGKSILITEVKTHRQDCSTNYLSIVNKAIKGPCCSECNVTFSFPRYLLEHCKEFHPQTIYPCTTCQNEYLSQESAEKHYIRVHSNKIPPKQDSVFTPEEKLVLKYSNYTLNCEYIYECFKCGKTFLFDYELEVHLSLPSCDKPMPEITRYTNSKFTSVNTFSIIKIYDNSCLTEEKNNFEVKVLPKPIYSEPLGATKLLVESVKKKTEMNFKNTKHEKITRIRKRDVSRSNKEVDISTIPENLFCKEENVVGNRQGSNVNKLGKEKCSGIISSKNLMDILQGKIVNLHGQSFLPLSEVMDHLKQISGIILDT